MRRYHVCVDMSVHYGVQTASRRPHTSNLTLVTP